MQEVSAWTADNENVASSAATHTDTLNGDGRAPVEPATSKPEAPSLHALGTPGKSSPPPTGADDLANFGDPGVRFQLEVLDERAMQRFIYAVRLFLVLPVVYTVIMIGVAWGVPTSRYLDVAIEYDMQATTVTVLVLAVFTATYLVHLLILADEDGRTPRTPTSRTQHRHSLPARLPSNTAVGPALAVDTAKVPKVHIFYLHRTFASATFMLSSALWLDLAGDMLYAWGRQRGTTYRTFLRYYNIAGTCGLVAPMTQLILRMRYFADVEHQYGHVRQSAGVLWCSLLAWVVFAVTATVGNVLFALQPLSNLAGFLVLSIHGEWNGWSVAALIESFLIQGAAIWWTRRSVLRAFHKLKRAPYHATRGRQIGMRLYTSNSKFVAVVYVIVETLCVAAFPPRPRWNIDAQYGQSVLGLTPAYPMWGPTLILASWSIASSYLMLPLGRWALIPGTNGVQDVGFFKAWFGWLWAHRDPNAVLKPCKHHTVPPLQLDADGLNAPLMANADVAASTYPLQSATPDARHSADGLPPQLELSLLAARCDDCEDYIRRRQRVVRSAFRARHAYRYYYYEREARAIEGTFVTSVMVFETHLLLFNVSRLTYRPWASPATYDALFEQCGCSLRFVRRIWNPQTDTHCLVMEAPDRIVVAFRGTKSRANWLTDMRVSRIDVDQALPNVDMETLLERFERFERRRTWPLLSEQTFDEFEKVTLPNIEMLAAHAASTDTYTDWIQRIFRGQRARVHGGFTAAYLSVRKELLALLQSLEQGERSPASSIESGRGSAVRSATASDRRPILFCGHSLGGALAILAAYDIAARLRLKADQVMLCTFGAPRVGNLAFAYRCAASVPYAWRWALLYDPVSKLPPEWSWAHCGSLVLAFPNGDMVVRPTMLERKWVHGRHNRIASHMMNSYAGALENFMQLYHSDQRLRIWQHRHLEDDADLDLVREEEQTMMEAAERADDVRHGWRFWKWLRRRQNVEQLPGEEGEEVGAADERKADTIPAPTSTAERRPEVFRRWWRWMDDRPDMPTAVRTADEQDQADASV